LRRRRKDWTTGDIEDEHIEDEAMNWMPHAATAPNEKSPTTAIGDEGGGGRDVDGHGP